jgi:hypothetical protein
MPFEAVIQELWMDGERHCIVVGRIVWIFMVMDFCLVVKMAESKAPILTTGHGSPVADNQNSLTAGKWICMSAYKWLTSKPFVW